MIKIISKERDIIKTLTNMMMFAGGMGIGILYHKYNKDMTKYMNKAKKAANSIK